MPIPNITDLIILVGAQLKEELGELVINIQDIGLIELVKL